MRNRPVLSQRTLLNLQHMHGYDPTILERWSNCGSRRAGSDFIYCRSQQLTRGWTWFVYDSGSEELKSNKSNANYRIRRRQVYTQALGFIAAACPSHNQYSLWTERSGVCCNATCVAVVDWNCGRSHGPPISRPPTSNHPHQTTPCLVSDSRMHTDSLVSRTRQRLIGRGLHN